MALMTPFKRLFAPAKHERRAASAESMWVGMAKDVPQWAEDDYQSFVKEGYNRNELVFSCIRQIATSASEARLRPVRSVNEDVEEITGTPLAMLLERPNRKQTQYEFCELHHTSQGISGNTYVFKLRGQMRQVQELRILPPYRMRIVPGADGQPQGYLYKLDGVEYPIAAEDIIHIKTPNLGNDWYGLSPLHVIARRVNVDANLTTYQAAFFANGGIPAGLLKFKRELDEDEPEIFRRQWRQRFGGSKAWDVAVLGEDVDYQQVSINLDQMMMPDLTGITEARICMAFQVPPILVGAKVGLDRATYSNYDQAFTAFWYGTVAPETRRLVAALQLGLETEFAGDWTIDVDVSHVRALQEDEDKRATRWALIFEKGGCSRDEFRTNVDLEAIGGPAGDAFRIPQGIFELTAAQIEQGAAGQMDTLFEKGVAMLGEARDAFGLPRLEGDDIRTVNGRNSEQTAEQLASGETPLKPPNITFAMTGPTVDSLPIAFEPMFPPDAVAAPKPPPVLPPGFGGGPPQGGVAAIPSAPDGHELPPPPNTPPELPAAQNRSLARRMGIRARTPRQASYAKALASVRSAREEHAKSELTGYFKSLAARAAGIIGRSRSLYGAEVRAATYTPEDLVPKSADGQLAAILRRIAAETAADVWRVTNESGLIGDVDWDESHPSVTKLLSQAAGRAIDINNTTRDQLKQVLSAGYEKGYTVKQIADGVPDEGYPGVKSVITETYANRAETIARTETAYAQIGAQTARYKASDISQVEIQDGDEDEECADRDGNIVDIDEDVDLAHPNCTLNLMPVLDSGSSDEGDSEE